MPHPEEHTMSLGDHLEELRRRLILALAAPIPLFIIFFFFSDTLVNLLLMPVYRVLARHGLPVEMQVLSIPEFLMAQMKLSFIAALVVTAPWVLYQAWLFIAPGLYQKEKRFVHLLFPGSAVLTSAGVATLYFGMLPVMLEVLVLLGSDTRLSIDRPPLPPAVVEALSASAAVPVRVQPPAEVQPGMVWLTAPELKLHVAIVREPTTGGDPAGVEVVEVPPPAVGRVTQAFRVSYVIDFVLMMLLATVVAFQLPLVLLLLGWLGIVERAWLQAHRRHALFVLAIISAVITPADVVSMFVMLIPLYALYELGIILIRLAPAHRVRAGGIFRFRLPRWAWSAKKPPSADKPGPTSGQVVQPVQSEGAVPRTGQTPQSILAPADERRAD